MRVVLLLPPRLSLRSLVSLESLYGMWDDFLEMLLITLPRVERLWLIFLASSRASPSAKDLETRSEPARSTRLMIPLLTLSFW